MHTLSDDIFESVVEQALIKAFKQNAKSLAFKDGFNNTCAYRSEAGCCIVGHMIDDKFYDKGFEGTSACGSSVIHAIKSTIGETFGVKFESFSRDQVATLTALQYIHDEAASIGHTENMCGVVRASKTVDQYTKNLFEKSHKKFRAES